MKEKTIPIWLCVSLPESMSVCVTLSLCADTITSTLSAWVPMSKMMEKRKEKQNEMKWNKIKKIKSNIKSSVQ